MKTQRPSQSTTQHETTQMDNKGTTDNNKRSLRLESPRPRCLLRRTSSSKKDRSHKASMGDVASRWQIREKRPTPEVLEKIPMHETHQLSKPVGNGEALSMWWLVLTARDGVHDMRHGSATRRMKIRWMKAEHTQEPERQATHHARNRSARPQSHGQAVDEKTLPTTTTNETNLSQTTQKHNTHTTPQIRVSMTFCQKTRTKKNEPTPLDQLTRFNTKVSHAQRADERDLTTGTYGVPRRRPSAARMI